MKYLYSPENPVAAKLKENVANLFYIANLSKKRMWPCGIK